MYVSCMYHSIEARWFYPGEPPENIRQWHKKGGRPHEDGSRADIYLCDTGEGIGIKLREGLVEIKQKQKDFGEIHFGQNMTGRVESWIKWGFPIAKQVNNSDEINKYWVTVEKKRWIKMFLLDHAFTQVPVSQYPAEGCIWEISQIRSGNSDDPWWSVCFELFGPKGGEINVLKNLVEAVVEGGEGVQLKAIDSYAYPAWLDKICG